MTQSITYYDLFKGISTPIDKAIKDIFSWWSPDLPPLIVFYGNLGGVLFEHIDLIDGKELKTIFELVESNISFQDSILSAAIQVGLMEALINRAIGKDILYEIKNIAGNKTNQYIDQYCQRDY